ncbi:glucosaminidase domain-containing protein [Flexithrix dorotheae]|uniref:glucosaminidase domain-containing protein n=1 Tax=Flexithrix dorotheae TaxID=70993 RepID=UPI0003784990|nr:glucosaminidase domain-containing protein [Flexithrix dorotheae]
MNTIILNQSTNTPSSHTFNFSPIQEEIKIQEVFIFDTKSFLPKFLIAFLSLWLISEIAETNLFSKKRKVEIFTYHSQENSLVNDKRKKISIDLKKKNFLAKKHLLISQYLINNGIPTTSQLSEKEAYSLNLELNDLFIQSLILENPDLSEKEKGFLTNSAFNIVLNALNEQWKNHIPFSILVAKTIASTNYGTEARENNFFALKDVGGGAKTYKNPTQSFEDFSGQLISKSEYANLFVGGKNFVHWANVINTYDCNEKDYTVFQSSCGQTLINIINSLHLDVLDY